MPVLDLSHNALEAGIDKVQATACTPDMYQLPEKPAFLSARMMEWRPV